MTKTDLQHQLDASVEDIEASPDFLDRVRHGSSRRLRRRRLTAAAATTLSILLAGSLAVATPKLLAGDEEVTIAAGTTPGDPYAFLMSGKTQGDLARDKDYLKQAVKTWNNSHATSKLNDRGIFDDLRGEPKVAWAGKTSSGPAALVVQQAYLHGDGVKVNLPHDGIYTLLGFIDTDANGAPRLASDHYPDLLAGTATGFLTGKAPEKTLVVVDLGKPLGYSIERSYSDDGSSHSVMVPLTFARGFSVVKVPAELTAPAIRLSTLPIAGNSNLWVSQAWTGGTNLMPHHRLWEDVFPPSNLWSMTDNSDMYRRGANDTFTALVESKSDPLTTSFGGSNWAGYGRTADGSRVLLGELMLGPDPSRSYAVLTAKSGTTRIIPGGIPDAHSALPVAIKLPDGQGWAVAQKGAQLSYRRANGYWSTPRANALLVPAEAAPEVQITLDGRTTTVPLS